MNVALLGYGYSGRTFHAPLLLATPGFRLALVSSRDPSKVHADLPDVEVIDSHEAAALHPSADLVVIATPNHTHFPLAEAALAAGKHVVLDKPFTVTLAEARTLARLAVENQRVLSVFHNRRWDSDFLGAQAACKSGTLGEIAHFESHMDRYRPEVRPRWREQSGPGAGLWFDLGPHLIDQALFLFGLPDGVTGLFARQRPFGQTDDWAHVILSYRPLQVVLHAALLAAGPTPRFTIHGTRGSWIKFGIDPQESQLRSGMRPGVPGWGVDPQLASFHDGATGAPSETSVPPGDYLRYYAALRDSLRDRTPPPVTAQQAVAVMAVLETALQSFESGRTLTLPLTDAERE